jgi:hypothetical protein
MNWLPITVSVKAGEPAVAVDGLKALIAGVGLLVPLPPPEPELELPPPEHPLSTNPHARMRYEVRNETVGWTRNSRRASSADRRCIKRLAYETNEN